METRSKISLAFTSTFYMLVFILFIVSFFQIELSNTTIIYDLRQSHLHCFFRRRYFHYYLKKSCCFHCYNYFLKSKKKMMMNGKMNYCYCCCCCFRCYCYCKSKFWMSSRFLMKRDYCYYCYFLKNNEM